MEVKASLLQLLLATVLLLSTTTHADAYDNDTSTCVPDDPEGCPDEGISENYWIYLVVYGVMLGIVYVPVLLSQISFFAYKTLRKVGKEATEVECTALVSLCNFEFINELSKNNKVKFVRELALGGHIAGNLIIIVSLLVNAAYFGLYWNRTLLLSEICLHQYNPEWEIEVVLTVYFLLYFCVRLYAGYSHREFWLDLKTIVDIVTIPHIFVSIALDRDWLGLRFLRILWFNHVIDLLKQLSIFRSQRWIDVLSLVFRFLTFWFTFAAAFHLLEVTGDPWHDFETRHCDLRFVDYIYFQIVTITTVGYGDISPKTDLGRLFVSLFIIGGFVLLAYASPTISEIFESYSLYTGSYSEVTDAEHVVVSGHITAESIKYFLSDFLHPDRKDNRTKVLLLNPQEPNQDLKAIIRKNFRRVKYFKGSVLESKDLERVKIKSAKAFVILSPNYSLNPESEDESNLMRVVSIKNVHNNAKIIVQLLQPYSLQQVVQIPAWNPHKDTAICKSELKLGLMAQNCLCPGISTFLSNLLYTTTPSTSNNNHSWEMDYSTGASFEVYKHSLPKHFCGKTYEDVARLCFMKLNPQMIMIAIGASSQKKEGDATESEVIEDTTKPLIYPAPFGLVIEEGMAGYFIAQDETQVSILDNMPKELMTNGVHHTTKSSAIPQASQEMNLIASNEGTVIVDIALDDQESGSISMVNMPQMNYPGATSSNCYKCKERKFEDALLKGPRDFKDHIILCTFTLQDSDELNLHSFVSPLRATTLKPHELKPILIIGNKECIKREWSNIAEFDDVFIIDGTPLDQDILKAANVVDCSSCIILGSTASIDEDPALIDKQPILCSLALTSKALGLNDRYIRKVTELYKGENVQFLDLEDEDDSEDFIMSQPFAQGECISSTIFDSLVAMAYFNHGAIALFKNLVTGGSINQAKRIQKLKNDHQHQFILPSTPEPKPSLYRPRFLQVFLDNPHNKKFHNMKFADVFEIFLNDKKLCIGIYRLHDQTKKENKNKRYVITSPHNMELKSTDIIFIMETCTKNQLE